MTAFSLEGRIKLDPRDFVKGARQAANAVDDVADSLDEIPEHADRAAKDTNRELGSIEDGAGRIGSGAGAALGGKMLAGFAALGVGAVMLDQINQAFAREDALNVATARFNLTAEEAGRFGKLAGELYADGYGEGVEQLTNIAAQANRRLEIDSEESLGEITKQVAGISKTWGEDFDAIIRSTSNLMQNDLAPNAQAALDLIVAGLQEGGNEAGDFLDTIDEYASHWQAVGISGEEAIAMMTAGIDLGLRDTDKIADAVKEMRIRIVENTDPVRDALESVGQDADKVVGAFLEGGPAAREAYGEVIAALADAEAQGGDTEAAVAIIGTAFEDMGPKALEVLGSVNAGLEDTEGRAAALGEQVRATQWDRTKREAEQATGSIVNAGLEAFKVADGLESLNSALGAAADGFGLFGGGADEAAESSKWVADRVAEMSDRIDDTAAGVTTFTRLAAAAADLLDETDDLAGGTRSYADVVQDAFDAAKEHTEQLERQRAAAQALRDEVLAGLGGMFSHEQATLQLAAAARGYRADLEQLEAQYAAGDITQGEYEAGMERLRLTEISTAEQALKTAEAYADAQGAQDGSTEQARLMAEELSRLAGEFPFLRDEIAQYIAQLGRIPSTVSTQLRVTGSGVAVGAVGVGTVGAGDVTTADLTSGPRIANARGTGFWRGGVSLVGEEGPELVRMPRGAQVFPANQTRTRLSAMQRAQAVPSVSIGDTLVRVEIDGREFDGMITTRIAEHDAGQVARYRAGRLN